MLIVNKYETISSNITYVAILHLSALNWPIYTTKYLHKWAREQSNSGDSGTGYGIASYRCFSVSSEGPGPH